MKAHSFTHFLAPPPSFRPGQGSGMAGGGGIREGDAHRGFGLLSFAVLSAYWPKGAVPKSRLRLAFGSTMMMLLLLIVSLLTGCGHEVADDFHQLPSTSRNISSFSLPFTLKTRARCVLYIVRSGSAERVSTHTMMRSPNAIYLDGTMNDPHEMSVAVSICEKFVRAGKSCYALSSEGASRSTTSDSARVYPTVQHKEAKRLVEGDLAKTVPENEEVLFFVEGDKLAKAEARMTPVAFAKENKGSFLIVTLRWYEEK
jgi:hypothetical protein